MLRILIVALVCSLPSAAFAETFRVGPGGDFTTVAAGLDALSAGDVLEIDAGTYEADGGYVRADNVTIRGVGGRPIIDYEGARLPGQKGIFVVTSRGVTFENLELRNAAVAASAGCNGAGIRIEGTDVTVRDMVFRGNENGILGTPGAADGFIVIEDSEFDDNGTTNSGGGCRGQSHAIYLNSFAEATVTGSYFHRTNFGHEYKSRALVNVLLYNRFANEDGNASREVEITEGGLAVLIGNVIQQSATSDNSTLLGFALEAQNAPMELYAVNNTFVNERHASVFIDSRGESTGLVTNNLFVGPGSFNGTEGITLADNLMTDTPGFVDRAGRDYHLASGSAAVDAAVSVDRSAAGVMLIPVRQLAGDTGTMPRAVYGEGIDVGAYELAEGMMMGDAGPSDAGAPDGGPSDAGSPDGGPSDAGPADARPPGEDATLPDGTVGDASTADAGPTDGGDGCGCTAAGSSRRTGWLLGLVLASALAWRRRALH